MRVSGHITEYLTTRDAVEAGFDEIQHLWWLLWAIPWTNEQALAAGETRETWHQLFAALTPESKSVRQTVELLAERGVAVDATLGYFTSESSPPEFIADVVSRLPPPVQRRVQHKMVRPNYFPRSPLARPAREQALANMFAMLPVLHEAGVPLLVGTDLWPGFGLHHEMELFVRAGIPAPDVLELATLGAARVMGRDDELGSVEPGKLADLILVDGDPTANISDIRRVVTVIKDGRVYDPAAIYGALGIRPCCEHQEVGR
jgi:imidazolonepropionase-like amidohydrolase